MAQPVLKSPWRYVGWLGAKVHGHHHTYTGCRFRRYLGKDVGALISNVGSGAAATAVSAAPPAAAEPAKGAAKEDKKEEKKEKEKPKVEEKEESDDDMGFGEPPSLHSFDRESIVF